MPNFFTKLFGRNNPEEKVQESPATPVVETPVVKTAEEPRSEEPYKPGVVKIDLHTGRPIDAIYLYIKQDNEALGYNDAIRLHNLRALSEGKERIKNKLKTLFDQVSMKYQDKILKQETNVKTYKAMGYLESEQEAQSVLDRLKYHLSEIERLRNDLENDAENVRTMIETYEKGFSQGMLDIMGGQIGTVAPQPENSKIDDLAIVEG